MTDFEGLVQRLRRQPPLSRNRNYDELSHPDARRARRLLRRLAGLKRDIDAGGILALSPEPDGYLLTIEFPQVRARRVAFLSSAEVAMLREDVELPDVGPTRGRADCA